MHQISPNGFGEALGFPLDIKGKRESFVRALDDQETVVLVDGQGGKVVALLWELLKNTPMIYLVLIRYSSIPLCK